MEKDKATADNIAYLASVLRASAQIPRLLAQNFRYAQPLCAISAGQKMMAFYQKLW